MTIRQLVHCASAAAALILASCGNQQATKASSANTKTANPYPVGTYEHFKAEPNYPLTKNVWKNDELLEQTNPSNSHIRIDLAKQRGYFMNNDQIVIDYPICSGIKSRPTPTGTFYILEKVVDKKSNRYGRIYDAEGTCVNSNADAVLDTIPEGGKFEGAEMHYWMRLTQDGVGHHIGPVLRRPASHACVRGPAAVMPIIYSKVKEGTRIVIE